MAYTPEDIKNINIRNGKMDISQGVGNSITNAVNLTIAILGQEKKVLATSEDYEKEIKKWLDFLYKTSREKIDQEFVKWKKENYPDNNEVDTSDIQLPE